MNLRNTTKLAERVIRDNSPAILTAVGVVGTVTTAYLTGKASFEAAKKVSQHQTKLRLQGEDDTVSTKERVEMLWKLYIPAVSMGVTTIGAIVLANRIGTRRAAAMAAAYSITEKAFTEYKEKVVEKVGKNQEQKIRDEVAHDRVNKVGSDSKLVMLSDGGEMWCLDGFSNQLFKSDMETLRKAQNDVNAQILHSDYATVSDFYSYVNAPELEETSVSGDLGWNTNKFLELDFSTVLYKEKIPCIVVNFATIPEPNPWQFR